MKILIVKLSAFGDIIHALPAAHDLLNRSEVRELHWLIDQRYAFVADILPPEIHVHTVQLKGKGALKKAIECIQEMRAQHFDVCLDLQGLIKSGLIARAISPNCYGFDAKLSPENGNQYCLKSVSFHPDDVHVVQQYRRIAAAPWLGCQQQAQSMAYAAPRAFVAPQAEAAANNYWQQTEPKRFVLLHIAGGWETKKLSIDTWVQLAKQCQQHGFTAVCSWGNEDEQQAASLICQQTHARMLERRLDLVCMTGILKKAYAIVGADTGLLHLAAALDCPSISFWGPSSSQRSAPRGAQHRYIESRPSCGPCFKRRCQNFICMDLIHASDIMEQVLDLDH